MHRTALSIALLLAIVALPVPASQLFAGRMASTTTPAATPSEDALGVLLRDPFLVDQLSFARPATIAETATGVPAARL